MEICKKKTSITFNSTETKYMEQTLIATNIIWARKLLNELHIDEIIPSNFTTIFADNKKTIALANNSVFQKPSKHITIRYCYTRNLVKTREIKLIYNFTAKMIANGFTKFLGPTAFAIFVEMLGLIKVENVEKIKRMKNEEK